MRRIGVLLCLFLGFVYTQDDLNYGSLDPSYYRYMKLYDKTSDKDIKKLISNIDEAHKKTGLFLGVSGGYFSNDVTSDDEGDYLFAYGAKFGYQSFLPSFFESIFLPNYVGRRIYIQYIGTVGKERPMGKLDFSSIFINGDMMIDVPLFKGFATGVIMGMGLGSMTYNYNANSEFGAMVNAGFGITFFSHNRLELELKLITNKDIDWMGTLFMAGYQYVF